MKHVCFWYLLGLMAVSAISMTATGCKTSEKIVDGDKNVSVEDFRSFKYASNNGSRVYLVDGENTSKEKGLLLEADTVNGTWRLITEKLAWEDNTIFYKRDTVDVPRTMMERVVAIINDHSLLSTPPYIERDDQFFALDAGGWNVDLVTTLGSCYLSMGDTDIPKNPKDGIYPTGFMAIVNLLFGEE